MAETKYGKHVMKAPVALEEGGIAPILNFAAAESCGLDVGWIMVPVLSARVMVDKPHQHDFDQFLCFLGSDPKDLRELGGEIELSLGEEGEKHIITVPTIVHLPPGLIHCPLNYKRVDRPIFHLDIFFAPSYVRKPLAE